MDFPRNSPLWALLLFASLAAAHGGHENVPDGAAISVEPLVRSASSFDDVSRTDCDQDSTLWVHILLMVFAFGIIFPLGMVLGVGLAKS